MTVVSNNKLKLIYLSRYLTQNTDENNPASTADILAMLEDNGISAERKSVYDDIEALKTAGYDVLYRREAPSGYYIGSREFELPELKLLVDSVQASKFITVKKSRELIAKLQRLCSAREGEKLQRQVVVLGRLKTSNESIYYNVDRLYSAISENSRISFYYCEWGADKKLKRRRNGERYFTSPWALAWDDENYYLIAFDDGKVKHYRVDKMQEIAETGEAREGRAQFEKFDAASYAKRVFGMFGGETQRVTFRIEPKMIGVFIDRFGTDIPLWKTENGIYAIAEVEVSAQFFGWLSGLGDEVTITEPKETIQSYLDWLKSIENRYN
ncbi:MAG: WYL domain-containing protein [Oscillospiraceae bacterium]|nr:WYL domain-containing protein [Oscillospiraceae bacterium]